MEIRNPAHAVKLAADPEKSAELVGLRYVSDRGPGIRRLRNGKGFKFVDPSGKTIGDETTLRRIKTLAIPPAWRDVWICPSPDGHLQATGHDARGRKQYRYHPRWRNVRDETKYNRMIVFAQALPKIRRQLKKDLTLPHLSRRNVLATVVRLLEATFIRVGNEEYARDNKSYGLTTMKDRHAEVNGSKVRFSFRGKSARRHTIDIHDRHLAKIVKKCQDLPGQELFQYIDNDGEVQDVKSEDVNDYLREISGQPFTAKDFRTWAGTVLAAKALREFQKVDTAARAKKNVLRAIETVAEQLGNTPAVCRKCYVHPAIFDSYLDGSMIDTIQQRAETRIKSSHGRLPAEEAAVLGLLQNRLKQEKEPLESKLRRSLQRHRKSKRT